MKLLKLAIPGLILVGGLLMNTTSSFGKKEYTAKEKKACSFCHSVAAPKTGEEALNAVGKCYKEKKSLEGCTAPKK